MSMKTLRNFDKAGNFSIELQRACDCTPSDLHVIYCDGYEDVVHAIDDEADKFGLVFNYLSMGEKE